MTWVIGTPTVFGYGLIVADVQVTLKYSTGKQVYVDCLQKIFQVGKSAAAGFAGPVQIGLALMEDLTKCMYLNKKNRDWIPPYFINKYYSRRTKYIYSKIPDKLKTEETSLIVIAAHPSKDNGIKGQPKMFGCIMKSPNFKVQEIKMGKINSIGCGNNVSTYLKKIKGLNKEIYNPLMNFEVGQPRRYGIALADYLNSIARENPQEGISKYFVHAIVSRNYVELNARISHESNKKGKLQKDTFPEIVGRWGDFLAIMRSKGHDVAKANALGKG